MLSWQRYFAQTWSSYSKSCMALDKQVVGFGNVPYLLTVWTPVALKHSQQDLRLCTSWKGKGTDEAFLENPPLSAPYKPLKRGGHKHCEVLFLRTTPSEWERSSLKQLQKASVSQTLVLREDFNFLDPSQKEQKQSRFLDQPTWV